MSEPTPERPGRAPRIVKPDRHWADLSQAERREAVAALGLPGFRADQISRHYFERGEADPSTWTDLPLAVRDGAARLFLPLLEMVADQLADQGTTVKTLYHLAGGAAVECVLMRYASRGGSRTQWGEDPDEPADRRSARSTLCVSSQAGCGIGCPFCATGQAGLQRNLTTAEIVEQVRLAIRRLDAGGLPGGPGHLNNIVFMGMGEPLANYAAVVRALRAITSPVPHGFGVTARGLTISTSGIVPRIADLAREGLPVTLAVSLHAPDDELRDELVPVNRRWPVAQVLDAAKAYFETTGRRVSIEYALMRDINDQGDRADQLARELNSRGRGWVHVNLIPLNPTPGSIWTASRRRDQDEFIARLAAARIPVTLRDTRGRQIDGACGQLAVRYR